MEELVKVTYDNGRPVVSARELHDFLEVETPYRIWFPRMQEYGFIEGADFNPYKNVRVQMEGNRTVNREVDDAALSIDMAKEICMIQRNEKGKIARQYFIQIEKDWNSPEKILARAASISSKAPSDYDIRMLEAREKEAEARLAEARNKTYELMTGLWDSVNVGKQYQALALNGYNGLPSLPRESFSESCVHMYDATTIAKDLGIISVSNKPHAKVVSAVIGSLELDSSEYAETPYSKNGHDGISIQYVKGVEDKVKSWFEENGYPEVVSIDGKSFKVRYKQ